MDDNKDLEIKTAINDFSDYDKRPEVKKKKAKKEFFSYLKIIAIAVAAALILFFFVIMNAQVPSSSMETTIHKGDRLIANRLAYKFSSPQRGDIAIFKYPDDESTKFVKRVIGLPGDTVSFKNNEVYINGEKLDESAYLDQGQYTISPKETFVVPDNCYFMLGDNRTNSKDSRYWQNSFVRKDQLLAKVWFKYFDGQSNKFSISSVH